MRSPWNILRMLCAMLLLYGSLAMFMLGIALPIMSVRAGVWIFHSTTAYSIIDIARTMIANRDYLTMSIVVGFSVVFPVLKYLACVRLLHGRLPPDAALSVLRWIRLLDKCCMLYVFIIAMLILIFNVHGLVEVRSLPGIYCFGASVITSMLLSVMLTPPQLRQSHPVLHRRWT